MSGPYDSELSSFVARVRRRWRTAAALRAWTSASAAAALVLALALGAQWSLAPESWQAGAIWAAAAAAVVAGAGWLLRSLRRSPRDAQVARFIEECCPELDDTLVTAVAQRDAAAAPPLAATVIADAVRRTRDLDVERIVSRRTLRRAGAGAAAATLLLMLASALAFEPATRSARMLALSFLADQPAPARARGDVPLVGPPHVEQVDVRYEYPAGLGMSPRQEIDGGDIYGPAGTRVYLTIHSDKPIRSGALSLSGGQSVLLSGRGNAAEGSLTIASDGSYRIALSDVDGMTNPGDTEYFIRTLDDRPPDVRIIKPANDRKARPIEEVEIEARADDDFGIAALELVYAVRGGQEKVVPFERSGDALTVIGRQTLYLEDLDVQPGDFITYYARTRDVSRGKRSTEARSDIFFLEVTPFGEEFAASQGQGGGGGAEERSIEALVKTQKDIIGATWKLDRRGRAAVARSQEDVRAIAAVQRDLREEAVVAALRARLMGDLRRRRSGTRGAAPDPANSALAKASEAMGRAQVELNALRTTPALPHEMTALNELLRAQAEVQRREVQRNQQMAANGTGQNRQEQDLSSLFDRELAEQAQTNYETPSTQETRQTRDRDQLARVRELARRQGELNRQQQELATRRADMPEAERRRELEKLTREQNALRQETEELGRQLEQSGSGGQERQAQPQQAEQRPPGQGAAPRPGRDTQAGQALREASAEMQGAASELRRQDAQQASERGTRALERLRELEQQLGGTPDEGGGKSQQLSEQLSRIRDMREQLSELERQVTDAAKGSQPGEGARGQTRGGEGDAPFAGARELLEEMRRGLQYRTAAAEGFNPGRSAPGTESFKQDVARWDELKVQLAAALERAESTTAAQLRGQQATDRLNAGASQGVPEQYRRLVDDYYRALAAGEKK